MTKQLRTVYDVVISSTRHMTAREIYESAKLRLPSISVATAYRNLAELCEAGIIMKIPVSDGPDHYDKTTAPHPHLYCIGCGKVADTKTPITLPSPADFNEDAEIISVDMTVNCLCPACRAKNVMEDENK